MFRHVLAVVAVAGIAALPAHAGTTFQLDRAHAAPGETIEVHAVYVNDTGSATAWAPARHLVLQWRGPGGESLRSLAYLAGEAVTSNVPVNNFARMVWHAVVPDGVQGLQAVSIEGEPGLLALDTSPQERSEVAGTPAIGPIVDAGRPGEAAGSGRPLPPAAATGLGVAHDEGAAPASAPPAGQTAYSTAAWEHFRTALSPHEPMYFVLGTRGGTNARFQISLKYRLFQPPLDRPAAWYENLYLGYTQNSIWDLDSPSKPFYDTTYNPAFFWRSESVWHSPTRRWSLGATAGVDHMSNGRDGDESRSLNSVFAQPSLNYRFDGGSTLSFAPRLRHYFGVADENERIADYRGRIDWHVRWAWDDGAMVSGLWRNGSNGREGFQVDLAWPLRGTWLSALNGYLHLQYVNGYGQSLLDYDVRRPDQFRVGLMFVH